MNKKMADADIDPFGEHESRPEEPTDEHIPLIPVGGGSTWEPMHEQETSFGGKSFETLKYEALESFVKSLYRRIFGNDNEPPGMINFHNFDLRNGQLYYKDNVNPLMTKKQMLRAVGVLADRLGKEGLRDLGFDVPVGRINCSPVHGFIQSRVSAAFYI